MRRFNYFCSILLVIVMPLMIVIMTSNITLRTPDLYQYHFNDSEIMNDFGYDISEESMSKEISDFLISIKYEKFQVYEDNGIYQDPVFDSLDSNAMRKARNVLNIELGIGILCLLLTLAIYLYFLKSGFKKALRNRFKIIIPLTFVIIIGQAICWVSKPIRSWFYAKLIGVTLAKDSGLAMILGAGFTNTVAQFITIIGILFLVITWYICWIFIKPPRIFY